MNDIPLWLDVDTGIDDSLALLYAAASPQVELVGVTCAGGNVEADQVASNTRGVLELAGRGDVPVAIGRRRPIARALVTTPETHGPSGIGYATLPPASAPLSDRDGIELLVESARRRPGEIVLVNLGPLTNLASAVLAEPALPQLLGGVYVMGGCFRATGNTAPRTEWNVHVDPEAAKVVYATWAAQPMTTVRPVVMGLDVTEQAILDPEHLRVLATRLEPETALPDAPRDLMAMTFHTPVLRYVVDALRFYFEFHATYDGFYGAHVHDPFVVAAAVNPTLVVTEDVTLDVELGGALTAGEVVADWRGHWGRPHNAQVAVEADASTFLERLLDRVASLAGWRPPEPRGDL